MSAATARAPASTAAIYALPHAAAAGTAVASAGDEYHRPSKLSDETIHFLRTGITVSPHAVNKYEECQALAVKVIRKEELLDEISHAQENQCGKRALAVIVALVTLLGTAALIAGALFSKSIIVFLLGVFGPMFVLPAGFVFAVKLFDEVHRLSQEHRALTDALTPPGNSLEDTKVEKRSKHGKQLGELMTFVAQEIQRLDEEIARRCQDFSLRENSEALQATICPDELALRAQYAKAQEELLALNAWLAPSDAASA